ncbi:MAG: Mur ligase family protein [Bacteroidota bacterium]
MTGSQHTEQPFLTDSPVLLEKVHILSGANYFSAEKVVSLRINLNEYDEVFTSDIPGFPEALKNAMPSLYEHRCSIGEPGGFFQRVDEGTLIGHVIEHVAIELQSLAGMPVGFGKTRMTKKQGVYHVVFRFIDEIAGEYAGKAAVSLINAILSGKKYPVASVVENLIRIRENRLMGFSTMSIVEEAENRGIPWYRLDKYNLVQLGTGKYRKLIRATITGNTSLIAVETTDNKFRTTSMLEESGIPVPQRIIAADSEEAIEFLKKTGKPVVIKPMIGSKGARISIGLSDELSVQKAWEWANDYDEDVIVQEFVEGDSYRILVIGFRFAAAVRMTPATICGDGKTTIKQLIENLNNEKGRDFGDKGLLSKVEIDEDTLKIIELKDYTLDSVLPDGETLKLKNSGNLMLGGKAEDMTDKIHPHNIFLAEQACKVLNIDVAGVDIISEDISVPAFENGAKILEINAAPDFKPHIRPAIGEPRMVQKNFVDMLFPPGKPFRVPLISVTGTHGKTLVVNILSRWLREKGLSPGILSSEGMFTGNGYRLKKPDFYHHTQMKLVLGDPTIDFALLETPVETILEDGLAYKFADIGILLNIDEENQDYYSFDHMRDVDDVVYAKSVVAEEVFEDGYSILNLDDPFQEDITERLYSRPVYFSANRDNEKIGKVAESGNTVCYLENDKMMVSRGKEKQQVCNIKDIPMLENENDKWTCHAVLASAAAMYAWGEAVDRINEILKKTKA